MNTKYLGVNNLGQHDLREKLLVLRSLNLSIMKINVQYKVGLRLFIWW